MGAPLDSSPVDSAKGWSVVLAGMVGIALGLSPVPFYTIGMFAPELARAYGWSFTQLMTCLTVQTTVVVLSGPLSGFALDRFGARVVALWSVPLFALSFMSLALNNGSLPLFYAQWAIMGLVGAGTLNATWTRLANAWFFRHRGLAIGLVSAGTGITGFAIKPFAAWLIGHYGWRMGFAVIGALPLVVAWPLVFALFRAPPGDALRRPDRVGAEPTVWAVMGTRPFWLMAAAFLLLPFALTAPIPNLENILKTQGFSLPQIGAVASAFGLAVVAGRVGGGWVLDRVWAPGAAFGVLLLPMAGNWLLAGQGLSPGMATLAIIGMGLGSGFEFDLLAYLVARYFGARHYGAIYGFFYVMIAIGAGIGPVAYGRVFDMTGAYGAALMGGIGCLVLAAVLLLALGPYPQEKAGD
ncbi:MULTISPECIES: MFS transporter [unclassified Novosphingobium]|uniref:MFS transporter n=1 Tax=unclassified Novosphingobium TaxID=2644732 RepID=UPI00086B6D83|nr:MULTISPECIES: MFS transporter [unclassified Novosphingobium]MDR6707268.1 MFS family permease [Novosphingobium sp. 1748]ODU82782.1 MAG: MFS transporter [Novosphingobium sp. SCN 63-17]OJX96487.1 MAG: MFS transporter [Novosphingobium sp. 63-713]